MVEPAYDDRIASCRPACVTQVRKVSLDDLPLSCPMPGQCLWDAHPRVYLALDKEGHAQCPYCGTRYELDALVKRVESR